MTIKEKVYGFPTKYEEGFTQEEIDSLVAEFPGINMEKFRRALMGNTFARINGEAVRYHVDIKRALECGIENRGLHGYEWD